MRKVLIDSNVYVAFKKNDPSVVEAFRHLDLIAIDITVIGELFSGFRVGKKETQNRRELEAFLNNDRVQIMNHDLETAEFFAAVFKQLRGKGQPIPTNDMWIAASAMQHGLSLYTLDKHFAYIDGLLLKSDY